MDLKSGNEWMNYICNVLHIFYLHVLTKSHILPRIHLQTVNSTCKSLIAQMLLDNQLRKHTSILTVFDSSEECVLLTMKPAELNKCLPWAADFLPIRLLVRGKKFEID